MKKNYLSKTMTEKSDMELNEVISENSRYTKIAIQAATWEIEKRIQNNENNLNSNIQEIESNKERDLHNCSGSRN